MIYLLDTHTLVWFFTKSKKLSKKALKILLDPNVKLIIPTIVLAEIKYLQFKLKIPVSFDEIYLAIYRDKRCMIYPLDEDVITYLAPKLEIHDAIICATAVAIKQKFKEEVFIITKDKKIHKFKSVKTIW